MASTLSAYGELSAKQLNLKDTLKWEGPNDSSKTISFVMADPTAAGNKNYNFAAISSDQSVLHDGSSIAVTQLDVAGAAANSDPQDTDNFLIDDAGTVKKITGANLKTYLGSAPAGTDGQIIVYNGC